MLSVVLLYQVAAATPCSSAPLCALIARAAEANYQGMLRPGGYQASIETEASTLGRRDGRISGATTVEQTSSSVVWTNDGGFTQHVVGSRSFPNAIPLSRLAFLRIGWVVPSMYGERLQVIARTGPGETRFAETLRGPLRPEIVVHPLASDRDRFYRYTGDGRPASRRIDGRGVEVIPIEVIPRDDITREETVFEGEMDLDPASQAIVRLYGRFRVVGRSRRGGFLHMSFEPSITLVDLQSIRLGDGSWAPAFQRFEIQTSSSLASGFGAARRVLSRFNDSRPLPGSATSLAIAAVTSGYSLTSAPRDSLRGFRQWKLPAGRATRAVHEEDFSRYRPERLQPAGPPHFSLQGYRTGDFLRLNRIEGFFTGLSAIERFRDAAPGLSLRAAAGYAWSEKTARGGADLLLDRGSWQFEGGAARTLDVTNKFRNQFDNPALGALVGRDPWDYLDRRSAGVAATRMPGSHGSILRLEFARVRDDTVSRHLDKSLFGGRLRVNRNITGGDYWRSRLIFDYRPAVSPLFAEDGVGFRAEVENATGDLDYTRVEARIVTRKSLGRLFFIARLHAGSVFATTPPQQQLFEMGGPAGLPGYDYKEFAGDRAVLFRTRITYPLHLLDLPFRLGSGVTLPSLAPAISLGFQGGFTDTRNVGGLAAVRALGDKRDDKTGELVLDPATQLPLPAAIATDRLRTSVDIRIGVFGDALAVGFARALERGRKTRFIFAFGRQF